MRNSICSNCKAFNVHIINIKENNYQKLESICIILGNRYYGKLLE